METELALDAAVVLSLGMNRVLGGAAGLAASGAGALAALAAARGEERSAALAEAERHYEAVREVIDRNARIAALAESAAGEPLPDPLDPAGRPVEELTRWCAATDTALAGAERRISARMAADLAASIFTAPPATQATVSPAASPPPDEHRTAELARILSRLSPDTAPTDLPPVTEAAARLSAATTAGEAEGLLTEVRLRVQAANRETARRREAARLEAAEREAKAQAEAERRYVLDTITTAFEEMGYQVDTGFETVTAQDGEVVLTHGGWADHGVRMRVEDAESPTATATLRASVLRTRPARDEDDRRLDAEREREWCDAFEAARERLAAAGVHSEVTWQIDPGVRELPVTPQARQTRPQTKQQERHREHDR
ncbi:response regulator receiver protein [Actinomadura craniellae]|uniref:Response regulator receiver protein n=1 Tax=Actinomadura craniellae TaxID=2231787 RepID=A0A365H5P0_9ACTN|nr:response regulator receiver protein [Actinomadura craniellae]